MSIASAYDYLLQSSLRCTDCGCCVSRFKELSCNSHLSIGAIGRAFAQLGPDAINNPETEKAYQEAVAEFSASHAELVDMVRECCMCSYCTAGCPNEVDAHQTMMALREILAMSKVTNSDGFESLRVDEEWDLFRVYRKVYGISFDDLPHLENVAPSDVDTLFFPGCALLTYAPELTRKVFNWLVKQGYRVVMTESCCGVPLLSAGFIERAREMRRKLSHDIEAAGITRIILPCPACMEELEYSDKFEGAFELIPFPRLLVEAGMHIETADTLAFFDSCHDRAQLFGGPLRMLCATDETVELEHHGAQTLCCGLNLSTLSLDRSLALHRASMPIKECAASGASTLVSACASCTRVFSRELCMQSDVLADGAKQQSSDAVSCDESAATDADYPYDAPVLQPEGVFARYYLELLFGELVDWQQVERNMSDMWTGKYGSWVCERLL